MLSLERDQSSHCHDYKNTLYFTTYALHYIRMYNDVWNITVVHNAYNTEIFVFLGNSGYRKGKSKFWNANKATSCLQKLYHFAKWNTIFTLISMFLLLLFCSVFLHLVFTFGVYATLLFHYENTPIQNILKILQPKTGKFSDKKF